ncbi:MAG: MafI family immunity protein [Mobilitalea sp.]
MNMRNELLNIAVQIPKITEKDKKEINEFLEHDEWGITIEVLCSILIEEDIVISIELYDSIRI